MAKNLTYDSEEVKLGAKSSCIVLAIRIKFDPVERESITKFRFTARLTGPMQLFLWKALWLRTLFNVHFLKKMQLRPFSAQQYH